MRTAVLNKIITKSLYIVTEGWSDAQILRTILNCENFENVYSVAANGYNEIPSVSRTIRLNMHSHDKLLIVFDSNTCNQEDIYDKISTMKFLTNSDSNREETGIFCMIPTLDETLGITEQLKQKKETLRDFLRENQQRLKELKIIEDIQKFINS
ncbi:MAG: hypothetical protein K2H22_09825 [Muribaculaceae bacterium]|nr:hypothetical protein [Muribaculaceae bacterium]